MEENNVKITGKIVEEPTYLLTARGGRKIYTSIIEIMRTTDPGTGRTGRRDLGSCRRQNHALWRIPIIQ